MKTQLRVFTLIFLSAIAFANVFGQCTIDNTLIYANGWGVLPDSATGIPNAQVNTPYSQVMNFKAPDNACDVDPSIPFCGAIPINWARIDTIEGLPAGMTYSCNPPTCQVNRNEHGCLLISGTPTVSDTFPLLIKLTGKAGVLEQTFEIDDYSLYVDTTLSVFDNDYDLSKLEIGQNYPNPFSNHTKFRIVSPSAADYYFNVSNLLGKSVYTELLNLKQGANTVEFNREHLPSGIYLYSISGNNSKVTKRMIID